MLVPIVGKQGAGKTLLTTYLLYLDYYLFQKIQANYKLKFPVRRKRLPNGAIEEYLPEKLDVNQFLDPTNNTLRNVTVGADEFWIYADSRLSSSKSNVLISNVTMQTRKRSCDIYFTAQSFMQLDKRIRNNSDYVFYCRNKKDLIDIKLINRANPQDVKSYALYAPPIYDLYDTEEIIDPFLMKKVQKDIAEDKGIEESEDVIMQEMINVHNELNLKTIDPIASKNLSKLGPPEIPEF